ncbi:SurA N-terminal domain-containing protein [Ramlibacter sp.]|uniref:SurA N-terminal domain-containing protein n=1 Tax=Ramlibacter sp. TaxID=1917967 RepID=UPI002D43BEE1|nr:SurA N-terminal domain-containing protein [Ramlibacter sp.]HYD75726.1 SurA N-terminal domain-containing protein [Ramlibacter sp.]
MFEFVRKHTRIMQVLLFLLIVPSFVLFGLEGYSNYQERGATVAKVDGREINQSEWDNEHRQRVDRLREQMPNLDAKLMDSPQARYATLEEMVRDRVLAAAASKGRLMASDQRLARELQGNEVIASLRGPDGKLDMEAYKQLLGRQGMSPQMFEESVRQEIGQRQVLAGVAATGLSTPVQAGVSLDAFFQQREIQVARFDPADYLAKVNPTQADVEAWYKEHPQQFQAPEQAKIEYLVLDQEAVMKDIPVNEQDLRTYYEQNAPRLEERRASHILVTVPKGASAEQKDKARAQAQQLLEQVKKDPGSFAEVAKKHSQDPGSAPNGGDLDFFARGAMTKPFEDAAFALRKGEISDLVETEFGFHIIQLTDIKGRSFEQMRGELAAEMRKQQAQRKFAESADSFSNAVYEAADGFKSVAERFKLEVKTATVQRTPAPGAAGVLASPRFLEAVFSPESIQRKRNTEAVEIAPGVLASARIVEHSPAHTRPLAEVQDEVRKSVLAHRAAELARKEGQDKLAAWKANPATAQLSEKLVVSRENPDRQPQQVVEAALQADAGALPALVAADLGNQGYTVVRVNRIVPRAEVPQAAARQRQAQYTRMWTGAETMAYYELLKDRFKAQILVPPPAAENAETATR